MRNRLVTLLLLLIFCGGLFAGAHPCQARETQETPAAMPACHGHEAEPSAPAPSEDDGTGGQHHCEHACHMVALVRIESSAFAAEPQAELTPARVACSLPLFTLPIDHIPLA